ncbi:agmatine/peptidylarginine deiminase [Shewanella sp. NIFS-20-20]|uniref:agmatine deiminase family protein n=1 Tax=Shewanella sp. NIFS-20-20 TaxID=2853806 RepID=UPI00210C050A|nr:agmatine deiminase family protein [Shewanella sp. NIFS-20-20]
MQKAGILTASLIMGCRVGASGKEEYTDGWFMPDESDPHKRTWMAFGASAAIWGRDLLPEVQRNLATLAQTIAKYEPVSMLVRENEYDLAREMVGDTVQLIVSPLDDLWIRDTGPVFVITEQGKKAAVNLNFNGWGEKQEHRWDAKVADFVASRAGVKIIGTQLVMEGGCIEVDGHGTAIITESCTLNANRNPGMSKAQFEDSLMPLLGLDKIIWLPGIKGKDITDGHTDFYARFARPGVVLAGYDPDPTSFDHEVTKRHLELLESASDAQGNKLEVITLEGPSTVREDYETEDFAAGYIGFYVCNDAVIMQEFGDVKADNAAKVAVQKAFPDRIIEQINIDGIAAGGGSIHCATQQEPMA